MNTIDFKMLDTPVLTFAPSLQIHQYLHLLHHYRYTSTYICSIIHIAVSSKWFNSIGSKPCAAHRLTKKDNMELHLTQHIQFKRLKINPLTGWVSSPTNSKQVSSSGSSSIIAGHLLCKMGYLNLPTPRD